MYEVRFNFQRLREDIRIPLGQLPEFFNALFGAKLTKQAVHYWFKTGSIPLERLLQILTLVRLESNRRLDIWRYIELENLELPSIYFAHEREVFERDGILLAVSELKLPVQLDCWMAIARNDISPRRLMSRARFKTIERR